MRHGDLSLEIVASLARYGRGAQKAAKRAGAKKFG